MFNTVPISLSFVSTIKAVFFVGSMKRKRTLNENDRVVNIVFVAEIYKRLICEYVRSRRFTLCIL
jgi:hypothetical protein